MYEQFLPYCVEIEVTHNHVIHAVDTFFPNLDDNPSGKLLIIRGSALWVKVRGMLGYVTSLSPIGV